MSDSHIKIVGGEHLSKELLQFFIYNAKDAAVTREIQGVQATELVAANAMERFQREMALQPICMHMSRRGMLVDQPMLTAMKGELDKEIANLQGFLDAGAGQHINVKSPDVKWLLYEKLKLPVRRNKDTKQPTADKYAIADLASKYPNPLLMSVLEIRQRRDDQERYLNAPLDGDGRFRFILDPSGTRTGRLASRATIYGTGGNSQNWPDRLRRILRADDGRVLWYIDLSQAEARVVAYLARCLALIELFGSGRDVHTENAARFFHLDLANVTEGLRYAAKRVVHGSNYGMGPDRLIQSANDDARRHGSDMRLTLDIAKRGQEAYFMLYPEIKTNFWYDIVQQLRHNRTLVTPPPYKMPRTFFGRWDEKLINEAYAFVPQSIVGELPCTAMTRLWDNDKREWKLKGGEVLLNVHDALVGQSVPEMLDEHIAQVTEALDVPLEIHGRTLRIPNDVKVGLNFGSYHKEKNPNGLMKLKDWRAKAAT